MDYVSTNSLILDNGTIKESGNNTPAILDLPATGSGFSLSDQKNIVVDTASPTDLRLVYDKVYIADAVADSRIVSFSASDASAVTYSLADGFNQFDNSYFYLNGADLFARANLQNGHYSVGVAVSDAAGNGFPTRFSIDLRAEPSVQGLTTSFLDGGTVPASAPFADFRIYFSEEVTGVTPDDFQLVENGTATGTITQIVQLADPKNYQIIVRDMAGDGALGILLKSTGTQIQSLSGRPVGGYSTTSTYVLDHTAPNVSKPILSAANDTGISSSDGITSSTVLHFSGTAEALSFVTLYDADHGDRNVGQIRASASGEYDIDVRNLGQGPFTIYAKAVDLAQNTSQPSARTVVTVDTFAPQFLGTSRIVMAAKNALSGNAVVNMQVIDSTAVVLALPSNVADNAHFNISGNTITAAHDLAPGQYLVSVRATDVASNTRDNMYEVVVQSAPTVNSIERLSGANADVAIAEQSVSYVVTFSQSVTGVVATDFVATGTGSASGTVASI